MPNVAVPIEVRQIGFAKEGTRATAESVPTSFISLTKDSEIEFATKLIEDPALRGVNARFPSFAGPQDAKGALKTPARAQNIGEFLQMILGSPVSTEQASFVVTTGVNDTMDFDIGAGALSFTLAAGTYLAGQTQADAGSLCALLYAGFHGADAVSTYTVSYSRSTGLFTITSNAATFDLKFLTGSHTAKTVAPLIGFAVADKTGAQTYTGTVVQTPPFKHVFTSGQVTQLPSYTFFIDRGAFNAGAKDIKQYNLGSLSKLKFNSSFDTPVELEGTVMAQKEAAYGGAWTPVFHESPVLMFNNSTVKLAGSASAVPNVKSWSCELDPKLVEYRPLSQQQYAYDFLAAGPYDAQGDMVVYFMDEVERAKFLAATQSSLEILIEGSVVAGGTVKYTLDLLLPSIEYEAFPFKDQDGFLGAAVKWRARYSTGSAFVAQCYFINSKVSY